MKCSACLVFIPLLIIQLDYDHIVQTAVWVKFVDAGYTLILYFLPPDCTILPNHSALLVSIDSGVKRSFCSMHNGVSSHSQLDSILCFLLIITNFSLNITVQVNHSNVHYYIDWPLPFKSNTALVNFWHWPFARDFFQKVVLRWCYLTKL